MVLVLSLSINFGLRPEGLEILFPSRKLWTGGSEPKRPGKGQRVRYSEHRPHAEGGLLANWETLRSRQGLQLMLPVLCWVCAGWSFLKDGKAPPPSVQTQPVDTTSNFSYSAGERSQVQGLFGLRVSEFKTSLESFLRSYLKVKSKRKLANWAYSSVVDICRACLWAWVQSLVLYNKNKDPKKP